MPKSKTSAFLWLVSPGALAVWQVRKLLFLSVLLAWTVLEAGCLFKPLSMYGHINDGLLSKSVILMNARRSSAHANYALYAIIEASRHPLRCDADLIDKLLASGANPYYQATYTSRTYWILMMKCPVAAWEPLLRRYPNLVRLAEPVMYRLASVARYQGPRRLAAIDGIKMLLERGANANFISRRSGCPILAEALAVCSHMRHSAMSCRYLDYSLIAALVRHGARVNARCSSSRGGLTPLHGAAAALRPDLVQLLLDAGARPNYRDGGGATPLNKALQATRFTAPPRYEALHQRQQEVVRLLQRRGAVATDSRTLYRQEHRWMLDNDIRQAYRKYCIRGRSCSYYSPRCWHRICRLYGSFRRQILARGGWLVFDYVDRGFFATCLKAPGSCSRGIRQRLYNAWRDASQRHWKRAAYFKRVYERGRQQNPGNANRGRPGTSSGGRKVRPNPVLGGVVTSCWTSSDGGTGALGCTPRNGRAKGRTGKQGRPVSTVTKHAIVTNVITKYVTSHTSVDICNQLQGAVKASYRLWYRYGSCVCQFRDSWSTAEALRRSNISTLIRDRYAVHRFRLHYRQGLRPRGSTPSYFVCSQYAVITSP